MSFRCGFIKILNKTPAKSLSHSLCSNIKNFNFFSTLSLFPKLNWKIAFTISLYIFFCYKNWYRSYKFLVFGYNNSFFCDHTDFTRKYRLWFYKNAGQGTIFVEFGELIFQESIFKWVRTVQPYWTTCNCTRMKQNSLRSFENTKRNSTLQNILEFTFRYIDVILSLPYYQFLISQ